MRNFLADKVALTAMIAAMGLPTTRIQAAFAPTRGFGTLPTLRSADDVMAFLTGPARLPLFGQAGARRASPGIGADPLGRCGCRQRHAWQRPHRRPRQARRRSRRKHRLWLCLSGRRSGPSRNRGDHRQRNRLDRPRRQVNRTDRPEVLYTAWKLPSPTAMSDNFWQTGSLIALVAPKTGEVLQVRLASGPDTRWPEVHPVSGCQIKGITLPGWQAVLDLAIAAHAIVPDNGLPGWDIALTPQGPLIIECNENTGHALYQLAANRGVLNAEFLPVFDQIIARNTRILAAFEAKRKAYQRAKARF